MFLQEHFIDSKPQSVPTGTLLTKRVQHKMPAGNTLQTQGSEYDRDRVDTRAGLACGRFRFRVFLQDTSSDWAVRPRPGRKSSWKKELIGGNVPAGTFVLPVIFRAIKC